MKLKFPVFNKDVARRKRGSGAEEMLRCGRCEEHNSVFVNERSRQNHPGKSNNVKFAFIVWEHWKCLNCGLHWTSQYGVSNNGVVKRKLDMHPALVKISKGEVE